MRQLPIAITAFGLFLSGAPATAQTADRPNREDVLKGIEECRALSVDFMREACLQAANQFLGTPQAPNQTDLNTERAVLAKERAQIEQQRAALAAQTQAQSENERLGLLSRLGLARYAEQKDAELAATITIERATYNRQKIYTFYTSDGDIIRQDPNALRMQLPDQLPATATLERRTFGSKWLTFTDNPRRSYRVKILNPDN